MDMSIGCSIIIYDKDMHVLIAKRSVLKRLHPMTWETIGGALENNETPDECIRREVYEEIGCKLKGLKFYKLYIINEDIQYVSIVYTGMIEGPIKINCEIDEVRWVAKDGFDDLTFFPNCKNKIVDFYRSIDNGEFYEE